MAIKYYINSQNITDMVSEPLPKHILGLATRIFLLDIETN